MTTAARRPARLVPAFLPAIALLAAIVAAPAGAVPARAVMEIASVPEAEARLVAQLNDERIKAGLVALQVDPFLMAVARERSADMVARDYFGHVDPDGRTFADRLGAAAYPTFASGETIAYDHYPTLLYSVAITRYQWMESPSHRAILLSATYNYLGVGLAVAADGLHRWTAIVSRSPDRTGAQARGGSPVLGRVSSGRRTVAIRIRASDVPLQALTAGLRDVQVQRRCDGGSWVSLGWTTSGTLRRSLTVHHRYEFRFRARDRAGNVGRWSAPVVVRP